MRQINIKNLVRVFNTTFFILTLLIFLVSIGYMGLKSKQQNTSKNTSTTQNQTRYVMDALKSCYKNPHRGACLKQAARDIFDHLSLTEFSNVVRQNEKDEAVFNTCHEASHYIGRIAYERTKNIRELFTQCQHVCLDGCYHGVIEEYLIEKKIPIEDYHVIASEVSKVCGKKDDYEIPELYVTCLHGLGHAVMFVTDNELPKALDLCDSLAGTNEQELCYTGALMANADSQNSKDHPSKYLKADDPMYPCTILSTKHQKKCYEYNTLTFYRFTHYNWQETIKLCGQVPQDYRRGCYQTMGGDQVGFTDDVTKIKDACNEIPDYDFKLACIDGAEGNLVMRYSSDFDKPLQFCTIMDKAYKTNCFDAFIRVLNRWSRSKEKKAPICLKIQEDTYKEKCLTSIN